MDLQLKNKVVIVTGSSKGIGKAIAFGFAKEQAKVVICSRNKKTLENTASEIEKSTSAQVLPVQTNLLDKQSITSLINKTIEKFEKIDILINNTGGPPPKLFIDTTENEWQNSYDLLMKSVINCCQGVLPFMKKQKWGRIVNMTSFAAKQPEERLVLSNAIRAGIHGLTKTLSNELAGYGVLVNAVCPGWTLTERVEELADNIADTQNITRQSVISSWKGKIPLGRLAKPEEISNLVVFLASESASYITGNVIQVDGGYIKSLF